MVSKCANTACSATFRYLHEGRLFHLTIESATPDKSVSYETATLERFWLCGECSRKLTVVSDSTGILVVPLQKRSTAEKRAIPARRWDSA